MASNFFSANHTLAFRGRGGERRLHYSNFHKLIAAIMFLIVTAYVLFITVDLIANVLKPAAQEEISQNTLAEYEARIEALVAERDSLAVALEDSKGKSEKLIENLGQQQDLLFQQERDLYELTSNVSNMRRGLINSQNRLDALNLQIVAQEEQIASISKGESLGSSATLSTMTSTLQETAIARDEARDEVQNLRQEITIAEAERDAQDKKRDILFGQIEDAIETSLTPLQSTLSKTGLNVNSLLGSVRQSYSGIGGIDVDTSFNDFGSSEITGPRVERMVQNLDKLSLMSYAIRSLPLANPVRSNYRMSSAFGYRIHPITRRKKLHSGQDMAGPVGTPIYAPGAGTVIQAGWNAGYGKSIQIRHAYGIETLYGHLSRINVSVGQHVNLGDVIGKMGSTGQSTGSHLHYEVKVNGNKINPMNFLRASNYVQ